MVVLFWGVFLVSFLSSKWADFSIGSAVSCFAVQKTNQTKTGDSDVSVFRGVEGAKAGCFLNLGKEVVQNKEKCGRENQFVLDSLCG